MPENKERYPVQAHYGSKGTVDLEFHEDGWPILDANDADPNDGSSREFRWAYGGKSQKIWVRHTNGELIQYNDISQCWIDDNDKLFRLTANWTAIDL